MKTYIYEGKTFEEAKLKALNELNITDEQAMIKIIEEKQGIIKKIVKIEVINENDLIHYIKEVLNTITSLMNIKINLEIRKRNKNIDIKIFSDQNSILIGKDGRTLKSLQNILRQAIILQVGNEYRINLDVENYKEKKVTNLERIAKKIAHEVVKTKIETKLDPMNSFERRIIHSTLSNNKYVYTESMGEEPNRYVIIKPKEK